jgi:outer membrane immunogenic protein
MLGVAQLGEGKIDMRILKGLYLLGGIAVATPALAADPVLMDQPIFAPVPIAQYSWEGFYAGGFVGAGWGKRDWDGEFLGIPINDERFRYSPDGALIGATIGYNWQHGQIVYGVEADAAWARLRDGVSETILGSTTIAETEVSWLATVRGRVGYAFDRYLVYGTGGIAFAGVGDTDVTRTPLFGGPISDSASAVHTGWTVGFGGEAKLNDAWSLKLEYLHAQFNRRDFNYDLSVVGPAGDETIGSARLRLDTVKVGLNYRF